MKTIVISDVHLGSDVCQAKLLDHFLSDTDYSQVERLIINGDLFDDSQFGRLKKHHWHILSLIRKMSDSIEIIHIRGNHDLPAEILSILMGVNVVNEYVLVSNNKSIFFHHGHRYDMFTEKHKILTWMGDQIYWVLQKLDPSFALARSVKHASKTFMRNSQIIEEKSIKYAEKHHHNAVITGHTHFALARKTGEVEYYNSGCWTELPCSFIVVEDGKIELHTYDEHIHRN